MSGVWVVGWEILENTPLVESSTNKKNGERFWKNFVNWFTKQIYPAMWQQQLFDDDDEGPLTSGSGKWAEIFPPTGFVGKTGKGVGKFKEGKSFAYLNSFVLFRGVVAVKHFHCSLSFIFRTFEGED